MQVRLEWRETEAGRITHSEKSKLCSLFYPFQLFWTLGIFHNEHTLKVLSHPSWGHTQRAAETCRAQTHGDEWRPCPPLLCSWPPGWGWQTLKWDGQGPEWPTPRKPLMRESEPREPVRVFWSSWLWSSGQAGNPVWPAADNRLSKLRVFKC